MVRKLMLAALAAAQHAEAAAGDLFLAPPVLVPDYGGEPNSGDGCYRTVRIRDDAFLTCWTTAVNGNGNLYCQVGTTIATGDRISVVTSNNNQVGSTAADMKRSVNSPGLSLLELGDDRALAIYFDTQASRWLAGSYITVDSATNAITIGDKQVSTMSFRDNAPQAAMLPGTNIGFWCSHLSQNQPNSPGYMCGTFTVAADGTITFGTASVEVEDALLAGAVWVVGQTATTGIVCYSTSNAPAGCRVLTFADGTSPPTFGALISATGLNSPPSLSVYGTGFAILRLTDTTGWVCGGAVPTFNTGPKLCKTYTVSGTDITFSTSSLNLTSTSPTQDFSYISMTKMDDTSSIICYKNEATEASCELLEVGAVSTQGRAGFSPPVNPNDWISVAFLANQRAVMCMNNMLTKNDYCAYLGIATANPTATPTVNPTTVSPTTNPTTTPTASPTANPTTPAPTNVGDTNAPTKSPTAPTTAPPTVAASSPTTLPPTGNSTGLANVGASPLNSLNASEVVLGLLGLLGLIPIFFLIRKRKLCCYSRPKLAMSDVMGTPMMDQGFLAGYGGTEEEDGHLSNTKAVAKPTQKEEVEMEEVEADEEETANA